MVKPALADDDPVGSVCRQQRMIDSGIQSLPQHNISVVYHCKIIGQVIPAALHDAALQLYRRYLVAGGCRVEQVKKTLENYRDIDAFKIFVSNLGLLCAKKDLAANDVRYRVEELNDFKGGMAENYVHVQLAISGYRTYY